MGLHTLLHKKDSSILANDALKEIFLSILMLSKVEGT